MWSFQKWAEARRERRAIQNHLKIHHEWVKASIELLYSMDRDAAMRLAENAKHELQVGLSTGDMVSALGRVGWMVVDALDKVTWE